MTVSSDNLDRKPADRAEGLEEIDQGGSSVSSDQGDAPAHQTASQPGLADEGRQKAAGADLSEEAEAAAAAARAAVVLAEFDRESNTRQFKGWRKVVMRCLLVGFSLYALWLNVFSMMPEQIRRASFVGLVIFLSYLLYPVRRKDAKALGRLPWYDMVLGLLGGGCFFYYIANFEAIVQRAGRSTPTDLVVAAIGIVCLAEVCRRVVGLPILLVAGGFVAYAYASGYSNRRVLTQLFYTLEGVMGTPIGVCSTFIVLFIMFGAFLGKTGVGKFFIDVANSIAGASVGGPAKVAVIASALWGMVSGSSVANTVGSGSFTIPMMKKIGYSPEFAGAVEAAASTGGQIMPPVMGAAAFLMAEMTGFLYAEIAFAAILPAFLYFTGIFLTVHLEAKKLKLRSLSKDEMPRFFKIMAQKGYLLLPLAVLVYCMSWGGFTSSRAAIFSMLTAIVVSMFRADTRMTPSGFLDALEDGARNAISVAVACAVAGIIVGVVTLTGVGLKLAALLLSFSENRVLVALFFTMIACIILGMGVPTTANYVIMATITAPIVVRMGIPVLAAHMFVFYFGIVADITPPVALAAYAGAAISGGSPFKTGLTATRIAVAAFIIPYVFALNPQMLLLGAPPLQALLISASSVVGMFGVAAGLEGYIDRALSPITRIALVAGGLLLIIPGFFTDAIGIAVIATIVVLQRLSAKRIAAGV